ncbi:hypothetical protein ACFPPA_09165 [Rhodanobacter ginsengisoli]|uniref:Uncharacterized protein n=1 Tax=Rhodanobacter ginsengisoli TaxID=418646 RepID=A0ABW0QNH1_9GAMM
MKFYLIANAIGLTVYLVICGNLWSDMPDGRIEAGDGNSLISFGLMALPILLAYTLLNVMVFVRAVRQVFTGKGWSLLATWTIVVAAWVIVHLYVRSHVGS